MFQIIIFFDIFYLNNDYISIIKVCRKSTNDLFEWMGFKKIDETIQKFQKEIENNANYYDIFDLFNCNLNESLKNISISIIKIFFFYMNKKYLDLHKISKLFSQC